MDSLLSGIAFKNYYIGFFYVCGCLLQNLQIFFLIFSFCFHREKFCLISVYAFARLCKEIGKKKEEMHRKPDAG
jgi:hypothetical protein